MKLRVSSRKEVNNSKEMINHLQELPKVEVVSVQMVPSPQMLQSRRNPKPNQSDQPDQEIPWNRSGMIKLRKRMRTKKKKMIAMKMQRWRRDTRSMKRRKLQEGYLSRQKRVAPRKLHSAISEWWWVEGRWESRQLLSILLMCIFLIEN